MGKFANSALTLTASGFAALMASIISSAELSESLPTVPASLLVGVNSADEVSVFSELAARYGYRALLHQVSDQGLWVLRLTASVGGSGGGYAPPPPPLQDCPGFRPRIPHVIVDHAADMVSSIAPRLLRWWIK